MQQLQIHARAFSLEWPELSLGSSVLSVSLLTWARMSALLFSSSYQAERIASHARLAGAHGRRPGEGQHRRGRPGEGVARARPT
jgi:hypothetical protein